MTYCVVAKCRLDLLFMSDLWTDNRIWETGQKLDAWVERDSALSGICQRVLSKSKSEFKRSLRQGAIDFGRNGAELVPLREDVRLCEEGLYNLRYGRSTFLDIAIPEPWYIGLWLRVARVQTTVGRWGRRHGR